MALTERQLEIFRFKRAGLSNKQIAEQIGRSESYVSRTLSTVKRKIQTVEDTVNLLIQLGEFKEVKPIVRS